VENVEEVKRKWPSKRTNYRNPIFVRLVPSSRGRIRFAGWLSAGHVEQPIERTAADPQPDRGLALVSATSLEHLQNVVLNERVKVLRMHTGCIDLLWTNFSTNKAVNG